MIHSPVKRPAPARARSNALYLLPLAVAATVAILTAKGVISGPHPCSAGTHQNPSEEFEFGQAWSGNRSVPAFDIDDRYATDLVRVQRLLAAWPANKPKGAYFVLGRTDDLDSLRLTISEFEGRFNSRANYPCTIAHDFVWGVGRGPQAPWKPPDCTLRACQFWIPHPVHPVTTSRRHYRQQ